MTNPPPFELFPEPQQAPYTYNDSRISYNEPCFCYNGGFDLICLYGDQTIRRRAQGRSGKSSAYLPKQYPEPEMVNLLFKTCVAYVNSEKTDGDKKYCKEKNYIFQKKINLEIRASKLKVQVKEKKVVGEISKKPIVEVSTCHVSSSLRFSSPRKIIIKSRPAKIKKKLS